MHEDSTNQKSNPSLVSDVEEHGKIQGHSGNTKKDNPAAEIENGDDSVWNILNPANMVGDGHRIKSWPAYEEAQPRKRTENVRRARTTSEEWAHRWDGVFRY